MNKFLDWFSNLDLKYKFILMSVLLVFLIIFLGIINNQRNRTYTSTLNYHKLDINSILEGDYFETSDREVYMVSSNIINNLIELSITQSTVEGYSYNDYYKVLDKNYKKNISKSKFKDTVNKFFESFYVSDEEEGMEKNDNPTFDVKMYENFRYDNYYLIELSNNDVNVKKYVGVYIDKDDLRYYIFYLGN